MRLYVAAAIAALLVDLHNDFSSEGGKLWPLAKETAEEVRLLECLHAIVLAASKAGIRIFVVPHPCREPVADKRWRQPTQSSPPRGGQRNFLMISRMKRGRAAGLTLRRPCGPAAFALILAFLMIVGLGAAARAVLAQTASPASAQPVASQPAVPGTGHGYLIDKHPASKVKCASCHTEDPPAKAVGSAACLKCHQDDVTAAVKEPQPNPHQAHHGRLGDIPCESCHHVHKESVLACDTCHNFNMKTP